MSAKTTVRPLSLCAGCGEVRTRDEPCPECKMLPDTDTMPCEECGETGEFALLVRHKPLATMGHPEDGTERFATPCSTCRGAKEVSRPFARASELWAEGFEGVLLLGDGPPFSAGCVVADAEPYRAGQQAARAYLGSLPAHPQGFEPPPRPVFRPTVEQLDLWAAQNLTWREHIKGFCPACGFASPDGLVAGLAKLGERSCSMCASEVCARQDGREPSGPCAWWREIQDDHPAGARFYGGPLWRRFDSGEMRELDFRLDGGAR